MRIFVDDGSTNIKLAWIENGEIKTLISANSFKNEWSLVLDNSPISTNYEIEREKYSFDPVSPEAILTTETRYQYGDINVVAIHHALQQSGIEPQPVDIVVTLPLSEYLDQNNQPRKENIQRKKNNVKRPVSVQDRNNFTICKVSVLPESVPAGFSILKELDDLDSLLIIDLGGTTLDISHVRSKMSGITKTFCDSKTGVSLITEGVKHALDSSANMRASSYVADRLIQKRNDMDFITRYIPNTSHREKVLQIMKEKENILKNRVLDTLTRFAGYSHVMVVGGGAEIVADTVRQTTGIQPERFFVSNNPQFDLVLGMMEMKG